MIVAFARTFVWCALCVLGGVAHAQGPVAQSNPQGEISLAQAVDAALRGNPDLIASGYELTAAQARSVQAGLRINPEVHIELENFAGGGSLQDVDGLETTLSLSQVVELGGKRGARQSVAEADLGLATLEQRTRELDVLVEITRRFIDVVAAQERARFVKEATTLSEQTLSAIDLRVEAGRSPEAERSRARIAVTRAQIEQRQADSELRSARYALSAFWGSEEPTFTSTKASLFELQAVESFDALMNRLEQSPDFLRFASEARLREAELRLARVRARPNLGLTLGARRFEESGDTALVAGFSMPLPLNDRNQGAIREAQLRLAQTDAQREAARVRTRASLFALYQEMAATRERVDTLRKEALPQAQLALEQTRSGYERGRFSFLELVSAQQETLGLQSAAIDAAADYHRLRAEIERLTGAALQRPAN